MAHLSTYDAVRCQVCGRSWFAHLPECSRHAYRPEGMDPGRYVLTFGEHAGATLDEIGTNEYWLAYLAVLRFHGDCPGVEREVITVFLEEARCQPQPQ